MKVQTHVDGAVLHVTLNRPDALNAIDPEMSDALVAAWQRLADDHALRVAVLSGAGPKAFSAGIDLKRLADWYARAPPGREVDHWNAQPGLGGITRNLDAGKPIVAAIHGHCLGGGLELALACDLRVASDDAVFGLPETQWGIIPGQGGTQRLPRIVGPALALEVILAGERLDAQRALAAGLVNRVVPRDRLLPTAMELARRIAERAPSATAAARQAVLGGLGLPLDRALELETRIAQPLRGGDENREAAQAFAEKRRPRWAPPATDGRSGVRKG